MKRSVARRHRSAAGHDQLVFHDGQLALRCHTGKSVGLVRLLDEQGAVAVVGPNHLARPGVESVQEDTHERPDAGCEIDRPLAVLLRSDDGRAADRPRRDHALVAEDLAAGRSAAELPEDFAGWAVEAIEEAVIAADIRPAIPDGRSEANRTVGQEPPDFDTGAGIVSRDAVGARRIQQDEVAEWDGFTCGVVLHPRLIRPGRRQRRRLATQRRPRVIGWRGPVGARTSTLECIGEVDSAGWSVLSLCGIFADRAKNGRARTRPRTANALVARRGCMGLCCLSS